MRVAERDDADGTGPSVAGLYAPRKSLDDDEVPLPTAFANLRAHSPPPMERGDSQREADHAWARAQAAQPETPAVAPPDRALSRSAPPSFASSSHGGGDSRTGSPRVGGDDDERFSDAESQDEVPDLPGFGIGTGAVDTPALSFTVEGASPAQPASSAVTPGDDEEDEDDVPISNRFANVLQRAFSPAPVRKGASDEQTQR